MIDSPTDQDFQEWACQQLEQLRSDSHPARERAVIEIGDEIRPKGKPALQALVQLVLNGHVGTEAVDVLSEVGPAALPYLVDLLNVPDMPGTILDEHQTISDVATDALVAAGQSSIAPLKQAVLSHKPENVQRGAVLALTQMGALEALIHLMKTEDVCIDHTYLNSRYAHAQSLSQAIGTRIGEPALDHLTDLLEHDSQFVRYRAVAALSLIGEPALNPLSRALGDPDIEVCTAAAEGLTQIGKPALPHLVHGLDDARLEVRLAILSGAIDYWSDDCRPLWTVAVMGLEDEDSRLVGETLSALETLKKAELIEGAYNAIIDELVIRESQRPDPYFNPCVTTDALQALIKQAPRLYNQLLGTLCDIAYGSDGPVLARSVSVARQLSPEDFAARVKARTTQDPDTAADIMRQLGGPESTAFFAELQTELQTEALENYHQRLQELEEIGLRRWEELTDQTRWGFYINMGMGIGLFMVGTGIIIWGLVLLTRSDSLAQQVGGGLLSAVSALATTYSGRFWKDPVQHVQRFSAQQARVQAAFIGYMNCIGQLRLAFERDYTMGNINPDTAERYQNMLTEAIDQVSQQLTEK